MPDHRILHAVGEDPAREIAELRAALERQRDAFAGLSGFGAILGFATAATLACASAYTVEALYYWRIPPFAPVMGELAMSIVFYVPALVFLGFVHRRLVGPLRSDF